MQSPVQRSGSISQGLNATIAPGSLPGYVLAEYVWIDVDGGCRSKTKVIPQAVVALKPEKLPEWNFDGSSTGQAPGEDSEVILKPAAVFRDPFRGNPHILVLCDCYTPQGEAIPSNTRAPAKATFDKDLSAEPWFGIEQEYTLSRTATHSDGPKRLHAFGGPTVQIGFPGPQGPYYCSAGADVSFGREIVEAHLKACLFAGIKVSGVNAEVMPGQWEYQVGPCTGIESGDHVWMSRYIMNRVCETYDVIVSYEPKPIPGDWNGAGCHTNYSTKAMREVDGALETHIIPAIEALGRKHAEHIAVYGTGNELRLTGKHETASIDKFSYGVANRGVSIRIPNLTKQRGKGYFEDRRPASNMDPYVVTSKVFDTTHVSLN